MITKEGRPWELPYNTASILQSRANRHANTWLFPLTISFSTVGDKKKREKYEKTKRAPRHYKEISTI